MDTGSAHNPYAPPAATIADEHDAGPEGRFIPSGRSVPAGNGFAWIGGGWNAFRQSPGAWIAMILVLLVLWFVLALIPFINILTGLLYPVFVGGLMIACENQRRNGRLELGDLFAGFQQKFGSLVLVGVISFGLGLLSLIPLLLIFGASIFGAVLAGNQSSLALGGLSVGLILFGVLFMLVISCLVWSLVWFAPALITLHELPTLAALKGSFSACWRNPFAGLLYGIAAFVLLILGAIPLLLGWLVVMPILAASIHASYRDIFIEA